MNLAWNPGGLEENVTETILHSAFIPFGDIKDVTTPLDISTQKHRGFGFVTYIEKEDAAAAMDNMHNAELYGRVLTVNYAQPIRIKGGEQGWASQPCKFYGSYKFLLIKCFRNAMLFTGICLIPMMFFDRFVRMPLFIFWC